MSTAESMRLDKWLWASRFFKTRQLAVEAINGGKVHLNGQRTKPGKEVKAGSALRIHKGSLEWNITVVEIPRQRRPANEAIHLYREEEASRERREAAVNDQRLLRAAAPRPAPGRPSKRDRRMIHRFTGKGDA
ncbi:MAG: RNA-binding S4 domain-containing protein [Gammaproteobacteria bacterium]|nr:RNA-binding S4 domain-containing protein [Gammaproteobacteria bacterium]